MQRLPIAEWVNVRTQWARGGRGLSFDRLFPWLLTAPATLILLGFTLYPTIYNLIISVQDITVYNYRSGEHSFIGLGNYAWLMRSQEFWSSVAATAVYVTLSVGIGLVIAFALALLLERFDRVRSLVSPFLLVPLMATPVVVALTWNQLLISDIGVVNYLIRLAGLPPPPWLGRFPWPMVSIIMIDIWQHVPFMFFVLVAGLTLLPGEPFEAAAIDGAGAWQAFRFLTLPLLTPVILVTVIFRMMTAFTSFDVIYVLTGGAPGTGTETLNLFLYRKAFKAFEIGQAGAVGVAMVLLSGIIALLLIRVMDRQESLSR